MLLRGIKKQNHRVKEFGIEFHRVFIINPTHPSKSQTKLCETLCCIYSYNSVVKFSTLRGRRYSNIHISTGLGEASSFTASCLMKLSDTMAQPRLLHIGTG